MKTWDQKKNYEYNMRQTMHSTIKLTLELTPQLEFKVDTSKGFDSNDINLLFKAKITLSIFCIPNIESGV